MKRYRPEKVSSGVIASRTNLCSALGITLAELETAISLPSSLKYSKPSKSQLKKDGSERRIFNPAPLLRKIQRRLNTRIFANKSIITWPDHLFGSVPSTPDHSTDYVACAQAHCGAKSVLSIDIKDFFESIPYDRVQLVFDRILRVPEDVASALREICTLEGKVVQGALTSSYLASLCLFDKEETLVRRLEDKGLVYTRLVDDITVSSRVANYDFGYASRLIFQTLDNAGLPANHSKTTTQYLSTVPLTVHGLRVGFHSPRLPAEEVGRIRAAVRNLERVAQEPGYRVHVAYRKDFNRCMGKVNKLSRVGHTQHGPLMRRLLKLLPLASDRDLTWCQSHVNRLERDYPTKSDTYGFHLRYYLLHDRLTILRRSFPSEAAELRGRWKNLKPSYE